MSRSTIQGWFAQPALGSGSCVVFVLCLALFLFQASPVRADEEAGAYSGGDRARDLVVWISGPDVAGAGVIYAFDGQSAHVMTALHVVRSQGRYRDDLKVQFRVWPGRVLAVDSSTVLARPTLDFATFEVDLSSLGIPTAQIEKTLPFDLLGSTRSLRPGDRVFTVGHTFDYQWLIPNSPIFFHSFTSFTPGGGKREVVQVETQCPPGHSGGALFDESWRLIGVLLNTEGPFCWALRVEEALSVLSDFDKGVDLHQKSTQKGPTETLMAKEIRVAVMDFENRSGTNLPDLGAAAHDIVTTFLVSLPRVAVVTRERIDAVLREVRLTGALRDGEQATRLGKLLDADAVLVGSIIRYDVERRILEAYGTSALMDQYRMTIGLQLIDVASGRVRFSKHFDVEDTKAYPQASSAPRQPLSRESELLRMLLDQAREEVQRGLMEIGSGLETAGELVRVPVVTTPEGADVLLGGAYKCSTPCDIQLPIGTHEVEIQRSGYDTWKRYVEVEPGTDITINLSREQ